MQKKREKVVRSATRFPEELHAAMMRLSQQHQRSFNGEVMWALQLYVERETAEATTTPASHKQS